ncbi:MAG: hypothetical protein AAF658_12550, partial [Myxococcota bacterium]
MFKRTLQATLLAWAASACGEQDLGVLFGRVDLLRPPSGLVPERDWPEAREVFRAGQSASDDTPPQIAPIGPDLSELPAPRYAGIVHGADGFLYAVPARARRFLRIDPNVPASAELFGPEIPDGEWGGAALGNNGIIYLAPLDQPRVFAFDPADPDSADFVGPDYRALSA